jgi:hypothetical protein
MHNFYLDSCIWSWCRSDRQVHSHGRFGMSWWHVSFLSNGSESFRKTYSREPNARDTARLLAAGPERGFLEMLRCIDYFMHYKCLVGASNVIHEAISSYNLWIWISFFDMAWSHNDINMLQEMLFAVCKIWWRQHSRLQLWDQCPPIQQGVWPTLMVSILGGNMRGDNPCPPR